ncbi:MAG: cation-translocating P-type ATPase, partial [Dehalococcoidia bacterium]|nr:cation-translocating P-type ATPase [Dehalococcoidia bacterium]
FAMLLSVVVGEYTEALVIFVIVLFIAILGFIQEYRAERAVDALKKLSAPLASVMRDSERVEVPARELAPGDIIFLQAGDRVPADSLLMEAVNLRADEAPLTGESVPVEKKVGAVPGAPPLGDRRNTVYMGTAVTYGRGSALVVATGMTTEFGKIAGMLQQVEDKQTPLQVNLDRIGKWLGSACLAISALVALLGILRGRPTLEMLIWGISLAVAAVPEALPAIVTISLAIGATRMVKRHALIRKLTAVETLGSVTVICSDKTGTLTQDKMTVRQLYANGQLIDVSGTGYEPRGHFSAGGQPLKPDEAHLRTLLFTGVLCNDARLVKDNDTWRIKGDPTEGALVVVAAKAGLKQEDLAANYPRVGEVPFSSERKKMTVIVKGQAGRTAYSKGAPEVILDSCRRIYQGGGEREITGKDRAEILEAAHQMAGRALRVLGLAYKPLLGTETDNEAERDMVFAGLAGMIDPPREEAREAIKSCDAAGIKSCMITGDHKLTAMAIARELGLLKDGLALSGSELDDLSDEDLDRIVEKVEVYARVSPAHKMRVVDALSRKGHVVAMTGDGVNDAPALKKAHIGVAMGITGTDVTREASDMVLTDDNFASIVAAVEEGRGIFGNIKKYLMFLLSCNLGEILAMFVAVLIGLPLPLAAVQILFVNLATDGLPALALGIDPPEPDIMKRPPRGRKEGIFTRPVLWTLGGMALWIGLVTLGVFIWALNTGKSTEEAQGLTFVTLILLELFNAFNSRSEKHSLFTIGLFTNRWLLAGVAGSLAMTLAVIYIPALREPFHTYVLSGTDWIIAVLAGFSIIVVVELGKLIARLRARAVIARPH